MQEAVTLSRGFGETAGRWFQERLEEHGIVVHGEDALARFEGADGRVTHVVTESGKRLEADCVVIGAGVMPDTMLARAAGPGARRRARRVLCDAQLRTSAPGVWAAGDVASYESRPNGRRIRVEHWDVAFNHGKTVALNMLGQEVEHDVVPYFFSDLADWASLEYVGPAAAWDREIVRGSLERGRVQRLVPRRRPRRGRAVGRALGRPRARAAADRAARADSASAPTRSATSAATSRRSTAGRRDRPRRRASRSRSSPSRCARSCTRRARSRRRCCSTRAPRCRCSSVECPAVGPVLLGEGEEVVQLDADRLAAQPLPLPEVRPLPPFEVDAVRAEITAPLGGVEHHARAVRALVGGVSRPQRAVGRVRDERSRDAAADRRAHRRPARAGARARSSSRWPPGWPLRPDEVTLPSGWIVQWGLWATSHGWPSGSTKRPE